VREKLTTFRSVRYGHYINGTLFILLS